MSQWKSLAMTLLHTARKLSLSDWKVDCAIVGALALGLLSVSEAAPLPNLPNIPAPAVAPHFAKTPNVALLIGNSYSFYNCGVHTYLRGLMRASDPVIPMKTRLLTISSGALSFHDVGFYLQPHPQDPYVKRENGKLLPMFDIVLLQEHSEGAVSAKRIAFLKEFAKQHADTIRAAGSAPLLVMTWTKENRADDIEKLATNTIEAANAAQMPVVPVGIAFEAVRKSHPDIKLYQADKSHPSAAGTYLYASVLYATLFKKSPVGLDYQGECEKPLAPEVAKTLQEVAWKTVTEFFGWKE